MEIGQKFKKAKKLKLDQADIKAILPIHELVIFTKWFGQNCGFLIIALIALFIGQ